MMDMIEIMFADMIEKKEYDKALFNLLAILNGDGGYYMDKHGLAKAIMNGIERFHNSKP
jgi:hypothetical protein